MSRPYPIKSWASGSSDPNFQFTSLQHFSPYPDGKRQKQCVALVCGFGFSHRLVAVHENNRRQTNSKACYRPNTDFMACQAASYLFQICFRSVSGLFLFPFCFLSVLFLFHCNCTRALIAKLAYRPPCILYKLYSAQKHSIRGLQHDAFATAAAPEKSTFRLCVWFAIAILL